MKQIKWYMMILLTVLFCVMSAPAMADEAAEAAGEVAVASVKMTFTDVAPEAWERAAIQYAYDNGLMKGESATEFRPQEFINRGMLVTILYRMAGEPEVKGSCNFWDVHYGDYYYDAVIWAVQNGIAQGVSATEFNANIPITKEQVAAIFRRYSEHKGYDVTAAANLGAFVDGGMVSSWAAEDVSWCVSAGLLRGNADKVLSAQAFLTRGETAAILMRYGMEYLPAKGE